MFHEASQTVYDFFWHDFCDVYLEAVKPRLNPETANPEDLKIVQNVLYKVLHNSLILLHPFMPFITEVIWQELPNTDGMLINHKWN
jgi:valyl-tRNA synthetase